ncbi:hypothetical protein SUGI_0858090 [Cryptomeria japonica]|nr:hypothetical protein SUGI_0858090 [Cryptomeria japonica]
MAQATSDSYESLETLIPSGSLFSKDSNGRKRLQKRAPPPLQVKSTSMSDQCRNRIPIPLLSPLFIPLQPVSHEGSDHMTPIPEDNVAAVEAENSRGPSLDANPSPNGWQHPAAPFPADVNCSFTFFPILLG